MRTRRFAGLFAPSPAIRLLLALVIVGVTARAAGQEPTVPSVARNPLRTIPDSVNRTAATPIQATPSVDAPTEPTPDELMAQRDQMWLEARQAGAQGDFAAALTKAGEVFNFQKQHFGLERPETCIILNWIADWQVQQADYAGAAATQRQRQPLCEKVFGADHWQTIECGVYAEAYRQIAALPGDDQRRLADLAQLDELVIQLNAAGDYRGLLEKSQQTLDVRQPLLGRDNIFTALSLNNAGLGARMMGNPKAARPNLEQAAEVRRRLLGPNHPATLMTLTNLAAVYCELNDLVAAEPILKEVLKICEDTRGLDDPATLYAKGQLATFYLNKEDLATCGPMLHDLVEKIHALDGGERSVLYAESLARLGVYYLKSGDFEEAARLTEQSAEVYSMVLGRDHPSTIDAINAVATVRVAIGNHRGGEAILREVLDRRRSQVGSEHPDVALVLSSLGSVYSSGGDYIRAESAFRESLAVYGKIAGPDRPQTAAVKASIGRMLLDMQDGTKAESYIKEALDVHEQLRGSDHPDVAKLRIMLAECYQQTDRPKEAEQLYKDSLEVLRKLLGDDHPTTAACMNNLANFYESQEQYAEAEKLYEQSFEATRDRFKDKSPAYGTVLNNAARVALARGNYRYAAELVSHAMENYERTLEELHPKWIELLTVAASIELAQHQPVAARPLLERALRIARQSLETAAAVQSERQQLISATRSRHVLDLFLALPHDDQASVDEIYQQVLTWKGAILARQMRGRRDTQGAVGEKLAEFQEISSRISTLALCVPDPSARKQWREQLHELNQQKESLEADLARESHEFRQRQEAAALTPDQLRAALPESTALVDVLEYTRLSYPQADASADQLPAKPQYQRRFVAFVVRGDRPIACVDLGPAKPIDAAIGLWRGSRGFPPDGQMYPASSTALLGLVWAPLTPHLDGCDTVLYSPDGTLSLFPLGVLPGSNSGTYLMEEVAIATIAVPQMLPEMLAPAGSEGDAHSADASLLLVGDVDYNAAAGSSSQESRRRAPKDHDDGGGQSLTFSRLKSTGPEIHALRELFSQRFTDGRATALERDQATEDAFRREAPQYRWLLLATHGFFAPPGVSAALHVHDEMSGRPRSGYNCGFMSGLAMAGANLPPQPDGDDGILTAFEVSALDLTNVDLMVLSGCETGLGQLAGGEGTMGLQRAFQLAGARTTVASLWTVPDQKTALIMQRFFANQWDNKMSKLEALREAQVWMMRTGGKTASLDDLAADAPRLPPYHWAAFVLSGDWR